jgi:PmbA protein
MIATDFLSDIVSRAVRRGATEAEALALETTDFSVAVRLGEVEKLQESASAGVGLRVIYEGRQASASTSDLRPEAIDSLIADTVEMARLTSPDDAAALPLREDLAQLGAGLADGLRIYDEAIAALPTARKIEMARSCEEAARGADARITNCEGARCATALGRMALVTSGGFAGEYEGTKCSLVVSPIARENGQMQVATWGDSQRSLQALDAPEEIGREAARLALRKLGARKVSTREATIVFEADAAGELLDSLFEALSGEAVFRRASFLAGKLNEEVAAPGVTIIDDGRLRGGVGSRPFDGEGLATRRTTVVERGVLCSYLLNSYTARKLGLRSTANAFRSLVGAPNVGLSNFYLAPGTRPPAEVIASVKDGFYVTEMIGFGFNPVTGDYSRGAAGMWIENGELTYPVEEVTIAGNFRELLRGVEMIGNDLRFRGPIAAPTVRVNRMMVSGG